MLVDQSRANPVSIKLLTTALLEGRCSTSQLTDLLQVVLDTFFNQIVGFYAHLSQLYAEISRSLLARPKPAVRVFNRTFTIGKGELNWAIHISKLMHTWGLTVSLREQLLVLGHLRSAIPMRIRHVSVCSTVVKVYLWIINLLWESFRAQHRVLLYFLILFEVDWKCIFNLRFLLIIGFLWFSLNGNALRQLYSSGSWRNECIRSMSRSEPLTRFRNLPHLLRHHHLHYGLSTNFMSRRGSYIKASFWLAIRCSRLLCRCWSFTILSHRNIYLRHLLTERTGRYFACTAHKICSHCLTLRQNVWLVKRLTQVMIHIAWHVASQSCLRAAHLLKVLLDLNVDVRFISYDFLLRRTTLRSVIMDALLCEVRSLSEWEVVWWGNIHFFWRFNDPITVSTDVERNTRRLDHKCYWLILSAFESSQLRFVYLATSHNDTRTVRFILSHLLQRWLDGSRLYCQIKF